LLDDAHTLWGTTFPGKTCGLHQRAAFTDSATDFHREKFHWTLQSAIYEQDGDSIDYRIAARAAGAADDVGFEQEALSAGRTDQPTQIVCSQCWQTHGSMLDAGRTGSERDTIEEMTITTAGPQILDGIAIAGQIKAEVAVEVQQLAARGITPGLAVILVGDVPASQIYVRSKVKTCGELGIFSEMLTPPESITTDEMLALVAELNAREDIDGILIQLPLPKHVDTKRLLEAVSPDKDVDGFHPVNVGRLQSGQPGLAPCTPAGIMEILRRSGLPVAGQNAVVVGRSDIVGKPAAMMLVNASATVTVCHSKTVDLARFTRQADLLVAAIGRPGFVTAEMVKPGATLIDVGINRVTDAAEVEEFFAGDAARAATFAKRGSVVVGDIHPAAFALAGAYTPVPGGVGALTIAMLMQNTVTAAKLRRGIAAGKTSGKD
jgi:methylenetetrahydrofolate dehydrogenase (NADP+) / methenyltetrahydrofolate cyclohydrolase